jgi:NADH dehydrogenase [ubiquinone] 1 alpha subcomplex assembly factor 7
MNKIINFFKKKTVPLDKFIETSLYNKNFGYYMKKNPFGKEGDYITSPLISNLFSEMVTVWCVSFWESLGRPEKILIAELGPGDGSLCIGILNASKNFEKFYKSVEINLLEKSKNLKAIQKRKIKSKKVKWIKNINEINKGPIIFIGNEFFDSLPIKQILRKKKLFFEKYVSFSHEKKKLFFLYKKANKNLVKEIKKHNIVYNNDIIEYPINSIKYLKSIAKKINKYNGGLLTFDYGHTNKKSKNTLQSIKNHKYINVLSDPGKSDITSHINYNLFTKILKNSDLDVKKITSQSKFLQRLGIIERANILSKNISFKNKADMFFRLKKMLHENEMGSLFKVFFAKKKGEKFSLGF